MKKTKKFLAALLSFMMLATPLTEVVAVGTDVFAEETTIADVAEEIVAEAIEEIPLSEVESDVSEERKEEIIPEIHLNSEQDFIEETTLVEELEEATEEILEETTVIIETTLEKDNDFDENSLVNFQKTKEVSEQLIGDQETDQTIEINHAIQEVMKDYYGPLLAIEEEAVPSNPVLNTETLIRTSMRLMATNTVEVTNFSELEQAIANAGTNETLIKIMQSFELTKSLNIGTGKNIILTANNLTQIGREDWTVENPADYANQGETKQRDIIDESRIKGESAINAAETAPLIDMQTDIILKRHKEFTGSLFNVVGNGQLTLGTTETALFLDGNKSEVISKGGVGSFVNVSGTGSKLTIDNALIYNGKHETNYSGPIKVSSGGEVIMNGGRITQNEITGSLTYPGNAGGIFVNTNSRLTMNGGLIDHNKGATGGVQLGDLFGQSYDLTQDPSKAALFNMNGGAIVSNSANGSVQLGGGVTSFLSSTFNFNNGMIVDNEAKTGGGIFNSDQYIYEYSNSPNDKWGKISNVDYEQYLKKNKSEVNLNGGLLYSNDAYNGGGIYIDSDTVNFNKTMLLDNHASNFGGGFYVSFPPRIQQLENLLVTENEAIPYWVDSVYGGGDGGGLWNCPTGYVHIGDGHTVYIFDNTASSGDDLAFTRRTTDYILTQGSTSENIKNKFYSHVSPVTKDGNIIKFLEDGLMGVDIPLDMSFTNEEVKLKSIYDQMLKLEAWKNANTFILGNTARNGGGIGSNANMETPEDDGDYRLKIRKEWDSGISDNLSTTTIVADIFIVPIDVDANYVKTNYGVDNKLFKYGEIDLNSNNNWEALFTDTNFHENNDLPAYLDKGLPFTAEELANRGYKYLVIEQGDKYYSEVREIPVSIDQEIDAGQLSIERIISKDLSSYDRLVEQDIFLYYFIDNKLTMLDRSQLDSDNQWKNIFTHPILSKEITNIEYYGEDRVFYEYGEGWAKSNVSGYHIVDNGYAFVLKENNDGTLTLQIPYLWIQEYDKGVNKSGFNSEQLDTTGKYLLEGNDTHTFVMTNYETAKLSVEKYWMSNKDSAQIPDSIEIYLLLDGEKVIERYTLDVKGNKIPIYRTITLSKENDWKSTFDNLNPFALANHRYSVEEKKLTEFLPIIKIVEEQSKLKFRISYSPTYSHIDAEPIEINGNTLYPVLNSEKFKPYLGDVNLNLYIDNKLHETQKFTVHETIHPITGQPLYEMNMNNAMFGLNQDNPIELALKGIDLRIESYDLITNEPALTEYNFYLNKNERGIYTLYIPSLVINGVPYDIFKVTETETIPESNNYYPEIKEIKLQEEDKHIVENYDAPDHDIIINKHWNISAEDAKVNQPLELKVTVNYQEKVKNSETSEIELKNLQKEYTLTADTDWHTQLKDIKGKLSQVQYKIFEEDLERFLEEEQIKLKLAAQKTEENNIPIKFYFNEEEWTLENNELETTIDGNFKRITNETIHDILSKGNYRYEIYEADETINEELGIFPEYAVQITWDEKNQEFVISYPTKVTIKELMEVNFKNTYIPEETTVEESTEEETTKEETTKEETTKEETTKEETTKEETTKEESTEEETTKEETTKEETTKEETTEEETTKEETTEEETTKEETTKEETTKEETTKEETTKEKVTPATVDTPHLPETGENQLPKTGEGEKTYLWILSTAILLMGVAIIFAHKNEEKQ